MTKKPKFYNGKKKTATNGAACHYWMSTCGRMQTDPHLTPYTKLKSKWIRDLNIKPDTLYLIEEKVGSSHELICMKSYFLNITPAAQTLRSIINK